MQVPPKFSNANLIPPIPAHKSEKVKLPALVNLGHKSGNSITIVIWTGKYFKVEVYRVHGSYIFTNAICSLTTFNF